MTEPPAPADSSERAPARSAPSGDRSWRHVAERGSVLGGHFLLWLSTTFGRWPARLVLRVVVLYYALFASDARRATHDYLRRVHGESSFGAVYTQMLRVAQVGVDSLFLLRGQFERFRVSKTGEQHLLELVENRRGAVLLGAHLGSMYAMRAASGREGLPIRAVVYTKHAKLLNAILARVDPEGQARLLQMGEGMDFMLRIRELIDEGALVALLGDRVGKDDRAVEVDFLGGRARFPTGPYLLASMLKCPVYLTFGLYRDPDGYDLHCEPFAERIELPRGERPEALARYAQQYADRLEHYTRSAPDNWFNFYDFWCD